ncbi:outer membrane scaffolding protein for murein synthesis (MipA/OmpV family) [Erwinia persicina]|jgi:outer membrane scaffolding protein for murein synthesis (MipA/OmpV family)|uniref:MipA/OmpV family protein n=1 Tax=Erwinia aeris TaxID=3239803 RepID=A0ABV4E3B3_9GAMM|nr:MULTISPECIES: MipA/OmpV family protein [Erwinia]MCP1436976.1 outer membrane scaffolding protein for murein synthesis (MipA/OmpV family) [Erwinia persicina]RRZ89328.1 MipA/OmpV family protein [Erwinia sp. 198]
MITRKALLYMAGLALTTSATARADSGDAQNSVTVGVGAQSAPRYSGSDQTRLQPVPVFQARHGAFFADAQKGIGYDLQSNSGLYLEHTLGYNLGRDDKNSDWRDGGKRLKGMGKIDPTVNTALAIGWQVTPWLSAEGKAVLPFSDDQGVNYQASLTLLPVQSESDTVALQTAALFGDARYMNTWYGVSQAQSQRSRFTRYRAPGGFYGIATSLIWSHQFDPHWGTLISAGYTWLGDRVADSPVVSRRNEATGTVGFTYTF